VGNETGRLKAAPWSHSPANHQVRVKGVSPTVPPAPSSYEQPRGTRERILSLSLSSSRYPLASPPIPACLLSSSIAILLLSSSRPLSHRLTFASRGPYSERVILPLSLFLCLSPLSFRSLFVLAPGSRLCFRATATMTTESRLNYANFILPSRRMPFTSVLMIRLICARLSPTIRIETAITARSDFGRRSLKMFFI